MTAQIYILTPTLYLAHWPALMDNNVNYTTTQRLVNHNMEHFNVKCTVLKGTVTKTGGENGNAKTMTVFNAINLTFSY